MFTTPTDPTLVYLESTANLGDFLNGLPVVSGLARAAGQPLTFVIRSEMRKFKGIREFLNHQPIFKNVFFSDEVLSGRPIFLSSWTREDKGDPLRPTETCRYENWIRDHYDFDFEVDDQFELQVPNLGLEVPEGFLVGDRANHSPDARRATGNLSHLTGVTFLDFDNDVTTNAYLIKHSPKPFVTCFTGVGIMADLMNKETILAWRPEDFAPEFRRGEYDIWWDNKNIDQVFQKHYYGDRMTKLVHQNHLSDILNK